jgi:Ca2+-transporting ATPase
VETLGAVSVLCVDKTGTITMNQMTVQNVWTTSGSTEHDLVETMGLGCETDAYDPMEKAMLCYCEEHGITKESLFSNEFVSEYAFTNELKMMGHVWRKDGHLIIAAKGSPERILTICELAAEERLAIESQIKTLSSQGLRVIAVAAAKPENESAIPAAITDCRLTLLGLVGLADPPRESVKEDIAVCNRAGIRVVMITGDNGITASAIARKIGIPGSDNIITGEELEAMSEEELQEAVKTVSIFSRVIPEHKMRIVKAFKENGEIVAMTGDGVNDAPALKYADIGIAMGKRGSEVSREASDLILMDDNFTTIVETIRDGRRIYDNIRKAVGYVFTIHIPIAAASLLAPLLGISPTALMLLPLHVVLLEVLIDPTCSIVLERQPAEEDVMDRAPRDPKEKLLTGRLLGKSVLQGIFVFAASFGAYFVTLAGNSANASEARAMGLAVIMLANLFLVQVNSSNHDFAYHSAKQLVKDRVMWAVNLGTLALLAIILYTPFSAYLKLAPLSGMQVLTALGLAAASVLWYELVKLIRRLKSMRRKYVK